ncbi:site-specific integrase [Rhodohalobacter sp. SW132]|uniref:site-specific integrase n=1 Tax=Rhodohalobacter sp. SW132 TaxID=2293433 RepID=UPI000E2632E1|nr:site-specific integrase [Rhodohalobacter sp. SW132]REL32965.1 site-specific integrase [Rhodohalobacter sp. SW132]
MAQISATLAKHKKNNKGHCPIYLRISDSRSTKYISIKESISESHWNENKSSVRKSHPREDELNNLIQQKLSILQSILTRLKTEEKLCTSLAVKKAYQQYHQPKNQKNELSNNFFDFSDKTIQNLEKKKKFFTHRRYKSAFKKLKAYCDDNLPYDQITVGFLREYETHLIQKYKNSPVTIQSNFKVIRSILYKAIDEDEFPQEKNPFFKFSPAKGSSESNKKLSLDEIQKIENLELKERSLIWNTRNYFLFSFYSAGIRFSDLAKMKIDNVKNGRLIYKMSKTGTTKNIKLMPQALKILDQYPEDNPYGFLFPVLDVSKDLSDTMILHSDISSKNALINKNLKKIASSAEIQTKISFHMARHSFADLARTQGWSIYDISKALGHKNIKVTERYLKKFDSDGLDSKMDSLFS